MRRLLFSDILIRFCERIPYAWVVIFAMDYVGVSGKQVGILTTIEMLAAILCIIPASHYADQHRREPFVIVTFIAFTLFHAFAMTLEKSSPCKINLLLNILGKRVDGFHGLETVMYPIQICDLLSFERRGTGVTLSCNIPELPVDSGNLVHRAGFRRPAGPTRLSPRHAKIVYNRKAGYV